MSYARAFFAAGKIDPLIHTMLVTGGIGYFLSFDHIIGLIAAVSLIGGQ